MLDDVAHAAATIGVTNSRNIEARVNVLNKLTQQLTTLTDQIRPSSVG